jgi:hypothetical protein
MPLRRARRGTTRILIVSADGALNLMWGFECAESIAHAGIIPLEKGPDLR